MCDRMPASLRRACPVSSREERAAAGAPSASAPRVDAPDVREVEYAAEGAARVSLVAKASPRGGSRGATTHAVSGDSRSSTEERGPLGDHPIEARLIVRPRSPQPLEEVRELDRTLRWRWGPRTPSAVLRCGADGRAQDRETARAWTARADGGSRSRSRERGVRAAVSAPFRTRVVALLLRRSPAAPTMMCAPPRSTERTTSPRARGRPVSPSSMSARAAATSPIARGRGRPSEGDSRSRPRGPRHRRARSRGRGKSMRPLTARQRRRIKNCRTICRGAPPMSADEAADSSLALPQAATPGRPRPRRATRRAMVRRYAHRAYT